MPSMGSMPSLGNLGLVDNQAIGRSGDQAKGERLEAKGEKKEDRNTPFTVDQLIDAWVGLRSYFKGEERLVAMLAKTRPEMISDTLCRITVANPWQKQEFAKFGKQVMDIVRNKLQNDQLKLQVEVAEFDRGAIAYTAAEKYKLLVGQNPHLAELKTKLGLQLE
jgi:hypothetical protein